MEPVFLTLEEVIAIHRDQLERYGGGPGIRDLELLKSAVAIPSAGYGNDYLHSNIFEMAAAYLFHIIRNHPFVDGNKRTGVVSAMVFLMMNGTELHASEGKLEAMVRSVAEGKMDKAMAASFFRKYAEE
jgi:death-on-curing protein